MPDEINTETTEPAEPAVSSGGEFDVSIIGVPPLSAASGKLTASTADENKSSGLYQPGTILAGTYRVIAVLGVGGMGVVYKVEHILLRQEFAIKTLNEKFSNNTLIRFQKEATTTCTLQHPNLVRTSNFGVLDSGNPYFVMDLAEGETVQDVLKRRGTFSVKDVQQIFTPICSALAYAHEKGVTHRDVKPGNIILTYDKSEPPKMIPKLVDFGIAKLVDTADGDGRLTRTGELFGTPNYMSPEQCMGENVDFRSDIYSLGCVVFEALTGAPPFAGGAPLTTMMQHRSQQPPSLKEASLGREFPKTIEHVVHRCLEKEPRDRYQSCLELARDLDYDNPDVLPIREFSGASTQGGAGGALSTNAMRGLVIGGAIIAICCVVLVFFNWQMPSLKSSVDHTEQALVVQKITSKVGIGVAEIDQLYFSHVESPTSSAPERVFSFGSADVAKLVSRLRANYLRTNPP